MAKKQGYNARLDESIGARHKGKHKQSLKDRRDESKAMSKKDYGHAYGADHGMKYRNVGKHIRSLIKKQTMPIKGKKILMPKYGTNKPKSKSKKKRYQ